MNSYLSHDELKALTGAEKLTLQIQWLRERRWLYEVTRAGEPRVAREYWRRRMVGDDDARAEGQPLNVKIEHNFSALRKGA